jgi:hypothetical protein
VVISGKVLEVSDYDDFGDQITRSRAITRLKQVPHKTLPFSLTVR